MNLPFQILCDYLEDKGIDTRLLRTQEPEGISMSGYLDNYIFGYSFCDETVNGCGAGRGNGSGKQFNTLMILNGRGRGNGFGDGRFGDKSGDGSNVTEIIGPK